MSNPNDLRQNLTWFSIRHLGKMLREDPEYRQGWQDNIAMAFKDEYIAACDRDLINGTRDFDLHDVANAAADRFLKQLEGDLKTQEQNQGVFTENPREIQIEKITKND